MKKSEKAKLIREIALMQNEAEVEGYNAEKLIEKIIELILEFKDESDNLPNAYDNNGNPIKIGYK